MSEMRIEPMQANILEGIEHCGALLRRQALHILFDRTVAGGGREEANVHS